jgi:hypothetical protein
MGKYDSLRDALFRSGDRQITMRFDQIEQLVGKLPPTAFNRDQWWSNEKAPTTRHVQARAWAEAGYNVKVNRRARIAVFTRD